MAKKRFDFAKANSGIFEGEERNLTNEVIGIFNDVSQNATNVETVSMLHISKLIPNERNNLVYDLDKLDALARDIAERGIQQPILVRQKPDGNFLITSGHRRYEAAKIAQEKYGFTSERLPCIIRDNIKDDIDEREALIFDNNQRDKSDYNRMMEIVEIRACGEARRERGEDIPNIREYIMQKLEIGTAEISRFERIHKSLCEELMQDFREKRISVHVAHEVAKLSVESQQYISAHWNREEAPQLTYPLMTKLVEDFNKAPDSVEKKPAIVKKQSIKYTSIEEGFEDLLYRMGAIQKSVSVYANSLEEKEKKILLRSANRILKEIDELNETIHGFGIMGANIGGEE